MLYLYSASYRKKESSRKKKLNKPGKNAENVSFWTQNYVTDELNLKNDVIFV